MLPDVATHGEPHGRRALSRGELVQLVSRACAEWTAGDEMPSLEQVRLRGSEADYEYAVRQICATDDQRTDREQRVPGSLFTPETLLPRTHP